MAKSKKPQAKAKKPEKPKNKSKKPIISIDYAQVEELAGRGLNNEQIALCLDIGESTLYYKKRQDPEFTAAIKRGHAKAVAAVAGHLLKHVKLGSMSAIIFWLKAQAGWKETSVVEQKDITEPPPQEFTDIEEAARAYAERVRQRDA